MKWNRREFIVTSTFGVVGSALYRVPLLAQPSATPEFTAVRGNVGIFTARGGTMGWLINPDAVVVVDSQFADTARMFLDGLGERTSRRIDVLINTHHHGDHTAGNQTLRPSVEKIVAHANVPGLQRRQAEARDTEAAQAYADETFDENWSLDAGGERVSARHYGPAPHRRGRRHLLRARQCRSHGRPDVQPTVTHSSTARAAPRSATGLRPSSRSSRTTTATPPTSSAIPGRGGRLPVPRACCSECATTSPDSSSTSSRGSPPASRQRRSRRSSSYRGSQNTPASRHARLERLTKRLPPARSLRRRMQRSEVLRRRVMERGDGPKRRASEAFRGAKCRPSAAKWTFTAEEAEAGWAFYARRLRPAVLNWRARFLSDG